VCNLPYRISILSFSSKEGRDVFVHDISTPHVNLHCQHISALYRIPVKRGETYETPVKLNAKRAILVASDRPLMEGEPVHDAALIPVVVVVVFRSQAFNFRLKWSRIYLFRLCGIRITPLKVRICAESRDGDELINRGTRTRGGPEVMRNRRSRYVGSILTIRCAGSVLY
jgi:hypothetical protein